MDADQRVLHTGETEWPVAAPQTRTMAVGASVVLLRPQHLRGTIGTVRRRVTSGWNVEIRSTKGTPLHLTLPDRAMHLR